MDDELLTRVNALLNFDAKPKPKVEGYVVEFFDNRYDRWMAVQNKRIVELLGTMGSSFECVLLINDPPYSTKMYRRRKL